MSNLNVSELDFKSIKNNLKDFLKGQSEFTDYNFDGSTINALLDVLAYTTHYNAFNANMSVNECFLDTAQLRSSVVSHAKLLGYTPRSCYSSTATIDIEISNPTNVLNDDGTYNSIVMSQGTRFKTVVNDSNIIFSVNETIASSSTDGQYTFKDIQILQGEYKTIKYVYDEDSPEKYIIPHKNVDTSSLIVQVIPLQSSEATIAYTLASNLVNLDSSSNTFWIQENKNGDYELSFGDGYIGSKITDGNIIEIKYISRGNNDIANGAKVFALLDSIDGNMAGVGITTVVPASGGSEREDIESIRFNAPLNYITQNRAVTPDDYRSIIHANYGNVRAVNVWGGENNDPPDYGKVYITIAPKETEALSYQDKEILKTQYLKPKNVVSITPIIVDPTYTYLHLEVFFKYNPNKTNLAVIELSEKIKDTLSLYQENSLKGFDGVFRYSTVLGHIDNSDSAIINSLVRVYMKKRFIPVFSAETRYELVFSAPIKSTNTNDNIMTSTKFFYKNQQCTLQDVLDNTGTRIINIVNLTYDVVQPAIGYIDEFNGKIILEGFLPTSLVDTTVDYIEVTVPPNSNDIAPIRNELLTILVDNTTIVGEVDTMITGGTTAGINYNTTSTER